MYGPDFAPLTSDQIAQFRRLYIRDLWDGATGLSRYNQANKKNFFTDDDLADLDKMVRVDRAEALDWLWVDKRSARYGAGDDLLAAETSASDSQLEARFRLLEAECLERMINDPAMAASFIVGRTDMSAQVFKIWRDKINADRAWAQQRASEFAMITLERM